jgi:NDP-sugar pyrophosphorylase family protein
VIDVAILTGGLGTRLAPITQTLPKALVDINGEPFIAHQLRLLRSRGINRVVLCVAYLGEMIQDFVGDGSRFDLKVSYSFDTPKLRGTAGAIKQAFSLLGEDFLVLYGDSYLRCDYSVVGARFRSSGKLGLMTIYQNEGRLDLSNVQMVNANIVNYDKKQRTPLMRHIDYGLGAFRKAAFADVPDESPSDLADLYRDLVANGQLAALEVESRFYEVGSQSGIEELSVLLSCGARNAP